MKTASIAAVLIVLFVPLSGCDKKTKATPPPQAQAPTLPPSKMVHVPDLPGLPPPPLRDVAVATPPPENPEPVPPHKSSRHKSTTAKGPADSTAQTSDKGAQAQATQVANAGAADASPIGQLSSSAEDSASQGRDGIERLVNETENGLNGIKRTLNGDEQAISTQIRTFLTKARQSLAENDLDGAQTLATKAKVLLEELTSKK